MQIISKGGNVFCTTVRHYPPEIVAQMKKAGYRVKEKDVAGTDTSKSLHGNRRI